MVYLEGAESIIFETFLYIFMDNLALFDRLQELEEQMVGGEKAHDRELKEKRAKRKKVAEKRIKLLAGKICRNLHNFINDYT